MFQDVQTCFTAVSDRAVCPPAYSVVQLSNVNSFTTSINGPNSLVIDLCIDGWQTLNIKSLISAYPGVQTVLSDVINATFVDCLTKLTVENPKNESYVVPATVLNF